MPILADVQKLEPGGLVRLYVLDATAIGGDVLRFHGYQQTGPIIWRGDEYRPWAIEATGLESTAESQQPRPTLTVGNVGVDENGEPVVGVIMSMCLALQDLVGARLEVHETLAHYLDAANFPEGNPRANASQELPVSVWLIDRRGPSGPDAIVFELAGALSYGDMRLPGRQIVANVCPWKWTGKYRGPYCGYTHNAYFDVNDNRVTDPIRDKCGGRVRSCQVRFGAQQGVAPEAAVINFGGFPAADRLR